MVLYNKKAPKDGAVFAEKQQSQVEFVRYMHLVTAKAE